MTEIQYVSDESGEPTAVIVPIELWREIESEKETAYLLKSESMKRRLLEAKDRQTGTFETRIEGLLVAPNRPGTSSRLSDHGRQDQDPRLQVSLLSSGSPT